MKKVCKAEHGRMKYLNNTTTALGILLLCALYSTTPLMTAYEFTEGGWDVANHINWAEQYSKSLKEGVLYPRWLPESNNGYGSPTMIFYPPLFYWLTAILNLAIPSLIISLKLVTFMGFFLSGAAMYLLLRRFCGNAGSTIGGVAYQLLPYHIYDLYSRGTLAEAFAFTWPPLILYFMYKSFKENTFPAWIGFSFSYAALILSHLASAYIFTFVVFAFAIYFFMKGNGFLKIFKFLLTFLLGLSISSVYFIPMFLERKYIHIDWVKGAYGNYRDNFLFLFGLRKYPETYMHLELGTTMLLSLVFTAFFQGYRIRKSTGYNNSIYIPACLLFVFSIFMATPLSLPVWGLVPGLEIVQFPWRWLFISALAASIIIGVIVDAVSPADIGKNKAIWILLLMALANLLLSSGYILTAKHMSRDDMEWSLKYAGDTMEYRPVWLTDVTRNFSSEGRLPFVFKEGNGVITDIVKWKSTERIFKVTAVGPSMLRVSTFYYPGWRATAGNQEIPIDIEKESGAMLLRLPPRESIVRLEFTDTPIRKVAMIISIISLMMALLSMLAYQLWGRKIINRDA